MATCCQSNSTFLIFAVLVVWRIGRVAVKHCFKLLSFLHLSQSTGVLRNARHFLMPMNDEFARPSRIERCILSWVLVQMSAVTWCLTRAYHTITWAHAQNKISIMYHISAITFASHRISAVCKKAKKIISKQIKDARMTVYLEAPSAG